MKGFTSEKTFIECVRKCCDEVSTLTPETTPVHLSPKSSSTSLPEHEGPIFRIGFVTKTKAISFVIEKYVLGFESGKPKVLKKHFVGRSIRLIVVHLEIQISKS